MKKIELIYREILHQAMEKKNNTLTQLAIAKKLGVSLSTVSHALQPLKEMGAISVKLKNFVVADPKKILYYWASARNITKDIIYQTRADKPVRKIESEMPQGVIFGAYSAYKFRFKDVPADYSEVYVYAEGLEIKESELEEIKKRFPENSKRPNLFVLKKDNNMKEYGRTTTTAQTFVDLWNLKEWYAKEFLEALKKKISKLSNNGLS